MPTSIDSQLTELVDALPSDPDFATLASTRAELAILRERCRVLGAGKGPTRDAIEAVIRDVDENLDARVRSAETAIANGSLRGVRLFDELARLSTHPLDLATPHVGDELADTFVERLFGTRSRYDGGASPGAEMIHYEPSPVSATLSLAKLGWFGEGETFVDLGSGTGRVSILASLLGPARAVGVEIDTTLADVADSVALRLRADVEWRRGDARVVPIDDGTTFFLFAPFVGTVLEAVLARIAALGRVRPIRVVSWGPSTPGILASSGFQATSVGLGPFDLATFRFDPNSPTDTREAP